MTLYDASDCKNFSCARRNVLDIGSPYVLTKWSYIEYDATTSCPCCDAGAVAVDVAVATAGAGVETAAAAYAFFRIECTLTASVIVSIMPVLSLVTMILKLFPDVLSAPYDPDTGVI